MDVDPITLGIDLGRAEAAMNGHVKAMFWIHLLGRSGEMDEITDFCDQYNLVLLEDCCEALGALHVGQHVGTFGHAGSLSFFFSHHLTTIEGGAILTNDDALADDLRGARAFGWVRDRRDKQKWLDLYSGMDPRFLFIGGGYNLRPMEIQGALGLVQLRKINSMLNWRRDHAALLQEFLWEEAPFLHLIGKDCLADLPSHSWMFLAFRVQKPFTAQMVKSMFEHHGIETRPVLTGNFLDHPAMVIQKPETCLRNFMPVADAVTRDCFMIGCPPMPVGQSGLLERIKDALAELKQYAYGFDTTRSGSSDCAALAG